MQQELNQLADVIRGNPNMQMPQGMQYVNDQ